MNRFDNSRVSIVLILIGGVRDAPGNGKGSKFLLLKFLAACMVLFMTFIVYFLSYLEMVSQLEAIAIGVCCLFSVLLEGFVFYLTELGIIVVGADCPTIRFSSCSHYENEKGGCHKIENSRVCVYSDKVPA